MIPVQVDSFIKAANELQAGNYIEVTFFKFQTTSDPKKALCMERIKASATQCFKALVKEGKSCHSLISGLENIESKLNAAHCFDSIYASVPKLPIEKLPNVILGKIFEFGTSQDWIQTEQTAKKFKNCLANDKMWEKEAKKRGLGICERPKDAVLEHDLSRKVCQHDGWMGPLNREQSARIDHLIHQPILL